MPATRGRWPAGEAGVSRTGRACTDSGGRRRPRGGRPRPGVAPRGRRPRHVRGEAGTWPTARVVLARQRRVGTPLPLSGLRVALGRARRPVGAGPPDDELVPSAEAHQVPPDDVL